MLVVISSENKLIKEAEIINELFNKGLKNFHLRKPNATEIEVKELLNQIDSKFYKYIALHQHHQLAKKFGINRIHLKSTEINSFQNYDSEQFVLSCSIHSVEEYNLLPKNIFNYCFLSPVFNSISKKGYLAKAFNLKQIHKEINTKIIALGGINETNCKDKKLNNFNGIVLLGGIWNDEPVEAFIKITDSRKDFLELYI